MKTQLHGRCAANLVPIIALAILAVTAISPVQAGGKKKAKNWTPPEDEWVGYFVGKKGRLSPLEMPIESNPDKDWVIVRYTEYGGYKPRVAVMEVVNKTAQQTFTKRLTIPSESGEAVQFEYTDESAVPVAAIEDILASALAASNRFSLLERKDLEKILEEQKFSNSDQVTRESANKIGQLLGARYLLTGTVNEWSPNKKNIGALGLGGKQVAEVAITIKLLDVQTGDLLESITERAQAGSWGIGLGSSPGFGGLIGMGGSSPINYAVSAAINKIAHRLCLFIKDAPWEGSIMQAKTEDKIYINGGELHGLIVGEKLDVFALGEELKDPDSGLILAAEEEKIGTIMLSDVRDKYSVASVQEGCRGIKKGDRVRVVGLRSGDIPSEPASEP